ncbi:MAG TPA: redoxin domain-containing protein, partial [Prolixibacteraceae bacterium]|nr:redoxin domain-containing protein [Prolixibacteraceae bacterium]
MKTVAVVALVFVVASTFAQTGSYSIKGKIGKADKPAVIVLTNASTRTPLDTVYLKKGKFQFSGTTEDPFRASLTLFHKGFPADAQPNPGMQPPAGREILPLIIEPAKMKISSKDSLKSAVITGSVLNDENQALQQAMKVTDDLKKQLQELVRNTPREKQNTKEFEEQYDKIYEQLDKKQKEINLTFLKAHPDSWLCLDLIRQVGGYQPDVKEIEPMFNALSERVRNTKTGKEFADNLVKLHKTAIGEMAPDFTQNDPDGKPVKLSDFRGKYLLVDFWASWCGPCRMENPNVVKTYNEFKDKNFTILGVSLDRENGREAWLKAIEKDQLTWHHVSDLKFWNNEVAKLYMVRAIPDNFLIGPDGRIVARGLRGDKLREKLAELI